MKEIIKKNKQIFIILAVVLLIVLIVPILLYYNKYGCINKQGLYDNLLIYFGSYAAFSGTVFLGVVTLIQTKTANEQNNRLLKLSEAEFIPIISILDIRSRRYESCSIDIKASEHSNYATIQTCNVDASPEMCTGILIELCNNSKYPINEITVVLDKYDKHCYKDGEISTYIACNESKCYNICTVGQIGTNKMQLLIKNIFNYQIRIEIIFEFSREGEIANYNYTLVKGCN